MRRADRLFQIVQFLRGGRLITAAKLAERLEVSERTIYRDIADLQTNGVPIDGEAGVGYIMREGFDLPPLMFNKAEIAALVTGARMVQAWGGAKMALGAEEALAKIDAILPEEDRHTSKSLPIHTYDLRNDPDNRWRLDLIHDATIKRQVLHCDYLSKAEDVSKRDLEPLGLHYWGTTWTLVAWCRLRDDYRSFRVDKFLRLNVTDETFKLGRSKSLQHYYQVLAESEGRKAELIKPHFY